MKKNILILCMLGASALTANGQTQNRCYPF